MRKSTIVVWVAALLCVGAAWADFSTSASGSNDTSGDRILRSVYGDSGSDSLTDWDTATQDSTDQNSLSLTDSQLTDRKTEMFASSFGGMSPDSGTLEFREPPGPDDPDDDGDNGGFGFADRKLDDSDGFTVQPAPGAVMLGVVGLLMLGALARRTA